MKYMQTFLTCGWVNGKARSKYVSRATKIFSSDRWCMLTELCTTPSNCAGVGAIHNSERLLQVWLVKILGPALMELGSSGACKNTWAQV
eukprot:9042773-Karenia_brevis.AAC.1